MDTAVVEPTNTSVPEANDTIEDVKPDYSSHPGAANPDAKVLSTKVFLFGVNDLSQKDVETFVLSCFNKPFAMEWVNDESVNIVYDTASDAQKFLDRSQVVPEEGLKPTDLRATKAHPEKPVHFFVRMATSEDKKPENAKELSRYYKEHGAPDPKENRIRFGSSRSAPLKFGVEKDLFAGKSRKGSRKRVAEDDLFPKLAQDDLFPNKVKKNSRRKNRNRRKDIKRGIDAEAKMEDSETTTSSTAPPPEETSIYSRMDY